MNWMDLAVGLLSLVMKIVEENKLDNAELIARVDAGLEQESEAAKVLEAIHQKYGKPPVE